MQCLCDMANVDSCVWPDTNVCPPDQSEVTMQSQRFILDTDLPSMSWPHPLRAKRLVERRERGERFKENSGKKTCYEYDRWRTTRLRLRDCKYSLLRCVLHCSQGGDEVVYPSKTVRFWHRNVKEEQYTCNCGYLIRTCTVPRFTASRILNKLPLLAFFILQRPLKSSEDRKRAYCQPH